MKRFGFKINITRAIVEIMVDADNPSDAAQLAHDIVRGRLLKAFDIADPGSVGLSTSIAAVKTDILPEEKTLTEVCEHCGKSTPKEDWGPGRITCPACHKRPLTVAERTK